MRNLSEIASEIRADWRKVNFGAVPYLDAMSMLDHVSDRFGYDNGYTVVRYFLANASTWRGEVAKKVKKELNLMVK